MAKDLGLKRWNHERQARTSMVELKTEGDHESRVPSMEKAKK